MTWKHGASAYRNPNIACRCDICRRANTERARAERAARRGKTPPRHDRFGYVNYGCRCLACTADNTRAGAERAEHRNRRAEQ